MRAVIKLEMIADDYFWHTRRRLWPFEKELRYMCRLGPDKSPSWVARLLPGMKRKYLQGTRDYSQANSTGSRGIFTYYVLADGIYEINDRIAWNRVKHYFVRVEGTTITEITGGEAEQWLRNHTLG